MKYIFAVLLLLSSFTVSARDKDRYINVTGTSEIFVPADQVEFNINIRVIEKTIAESKKQADNSAVNIVNILTNAGIKKDDIQVNPTTFGKNYEYKDGQSRQNGYYAAIMISFTLKDISKYYDITNELSKDNSLEVSSYFSLADYEKHNQDAYEKALKAALNKAAYMAKAAGVTLGKVMEIDENNPSYPMPFNVRTMEKLDSSAGGVTPQGKIQINKTIRVMFEIE